MAVENKVISFIEDIEATVERHGLPLSLSEVEESNIISSDMGNIVFVLGDKHHIGVYVDGEYRGDEFDALEEGFSDNLQDFIRWLDTVVPLENTLYTSFSFAIKQLFKLGYKYPKSITKTYLMKDEATGQTKIGKSKVPQRRERTLQAEKPTISLLYVCDCDVENELHKQYADKRTRGEWFTLTEDDINYICRNYNFYEYEPD